jgi:hypothetical protein
MLKEENPEEMKKKLFPMLLDFCNPNLELSDNMLEKD